MKRKGPSYIIAHLSRTYSEHGPRKNLQSSWGKKFKEVVKKISKEKNQDYLQQSLSATIPRKVWTIAQRNSEKDPFGHNE